MNVLLKVLSPPETAKIAHSIMAYERLTDELGLEVPVPLFLDTLALKIARVPPADKHGALSYPLDAKAVDTFRFLLGVNVDLEKWEYFLEPTVGYLSNLAPSKLKAVTLLHQVTPHPRYCRTAKPRISERELVFPTLRLLEQGDGGWMGTRELIVRLAEVFAPSGRRAKITGARPDTYLSQKVRTMIGHRDQPSSFIHRGLARYERDGLRISGLGRDTVRALLA